MGLYVFRNPKTRATKEVVQAINDPHVYSENGVEWERVFTIPQASIDTKIDPLSAKDFTEKTGRKRGTLGNMFDASKEASEQRKAIMGHDPVKKKYWDDYSKKRGGKRHPKSYEDN